MTEHQREFDGPDYASLKVVRQADGQDRRSTAIRQYSLAAEFAHQHGFELIQHTDAHYKVKTDHFLLEVYPGNKRIYRHDRNAPFIELKDDWTLLDVVQSVAKILDKMPKSEEPPKQKEDRSSLGEFKEASVFAAKHGFTLLRRKISVGALDYEYVAQISRSCWQIVIDPVGRTITRVDDKGPHPDVQANWTLIDVVKAIHKRLEHHGYQKRK